MNQAAALALLGSSMLLSALTLAAPSSGCAWFENLESAPVNESCCVSPETYFWCEVEVEGPLKGEYTPVDIYHCFADIDAAHAQAGAIAVAQNQTPGTVAREAGCWPRGCPGTGGGAP